MRRSRSHAQDVGLFRKIRGGLSCREYESAAEAVPEAFGLARSSVSRRFIRASAHELRRRQEWRLDLAEWLVLVLDGKTFAGDQLVLALGVPATGEKRILGLVQTASENKCVIAQLLRDLGERVVVIDGAKTRSCVGGTRESASYAIYDDNTQLIMATGRILTVDARIARTAWDSAVRDLAPRSRRVIRCDVQKLGRMFVTQQVEFRDDSLTATLWSDSTFGAITVGLELRLDPNDCAPPIGPPGSA